MNFLDKEGVAHLWKHIVAKLNSKVETENGKGLSTNDFTNEEKEKLANMESFVETKVAALVDSAPETLNTLNELSAALGDDPNFATTIATQIGGKVDKENGKGLSSNDFTTEEKEKLASAVLSVNGIEPDENGDVLFGKVLKTASNMDTEADGTVISNPTRCFFIIDGSNYGVPLNNYNQYTAQELVDCSKKSYINVVFERTVMNDEGSPKYYHTKAESISTNVYKYYFGDHLAPIIVDGDNNTFTLDPDWNGNVWFAGDVYVGGTGQDDINAKKLVTEEEVSSPKSGIRLIDEVNGYTYTLAMRNGELVTYISTDRIEITQMPNKTTYMEGESFDIEGMVVTAYGQDGSSKDITNTITVEPISLGDTVATITYNEGGATYTTTINITVQAFDPTIALIDFNYTSSNDTYTLTSWKGTTNGVAGTEIIIPNSDKVRV